MMFHKHTVLGGLLALMMNATAFADLAIIGHADTEVDSLDVQSVKKIFLGERQSFPNGLKAIPVHHAAGSPDREAFFDNVLGMAESGHRRHWSRMRATGRGYSPAELGSYQELLQWVAGNLGGIAYIDTNQLDDSVKVLLTIKDFDGV